MDPELQTAEDIYVSKKVWKIKLFVGESLKRCRAVLFENLTYEEADKLYERINISLGHTQRDEDGEILVLARNGPYVLIG